MVMFVAPPGPPLMAILSSPSRDGHVLRAVAGINAVRVARKRVWPVGKPLRRVDLHAPYRKPVPMVVAHVKIRRVLQCNPIKRKVVGIVDHNQPRHLLGAAFACLLRKVPPGVLRAEYLFAAAAVDRAVTHDRRVACALHRNQRLAAAAPTATDNAAASRRNRENRRIARGIKRHPQPHDQRHIGLQLQRPAQKCVVGLVHVQQHGAPLAAFIDSFLNARGVELLLVLRRQGVPVAL
jgi:hypothetical protein